MGRELFFPQNSVSRRSAPVGEDGEFERKIQKFKISEPENPQTATPDTHTNRGHMATYRKRQMTKQAAEKW
jgi:hypothetical protein